MFQESGGIVGISDSIKSRLLWADSLKGWLMLLVILGHAIQSVVPETCFHDQLWN